MDIELEAISNKMISLEADIYVSNKYFVLLFLKLFYISFNYVMKYKADNISSIAIYLKINHHCCLYFI